jgi:hypothetical protein
MHFSSHWAVVNSELICTVVQANCPLKMDGFCVVSPLGLVEALAASIIRAMTHRCDEGGSKYL